MKQKNLRSSHIICWLCFIIVSVVLSGSVVHAQNQEVGQDNKQIWENNCAFFNKYWSELIFTATQKGDSILWVAHDRAAYMSIFDGLLLDGEPTLKSRRDNILKMIHEAPGGNSVVISAELNREVDMLWDAVMKKAQSFGVQCKE